MLVNSTKSKIRSRKGCDILEMFWFLDRRMSIKSPWIHFLCILAMLKLINEKDVIEELMAFICVAFLVNGFKITTHQPRKKYNTNQRFMTILSIFGCILQNGISELHYIYMYQSYLLDFFILFLTIK